MGKVVLAVMLTVVTVGLVSCAQEIGARLQVDDGGLSVTGWAGLNVEWGGVDWSGRTEWVLLPAALRSISASATLPWEWGSARSSVAHSFGGRTQLTGQFDAELEALRDPVELRLSAGSRSRVTLGGEHMSPSLGCWASLRVQRSVWWGETRVDAIWPWAGLDWSTAVGVDDSSWLQVHVSGQGLSVVGAGVELGAASGLWSTSASVLVLPAVSQSVSVRWGEESFRVHVRLRVRAGGAWTAQAGASGGADHLRWSLQFDLDPAGWRRASLELRLSL